MTVTTHTRMCFFTSRLCGDHMKRAYHVIQSTTNGWKSWTRNKLLLLAVRSSSLQRWGRPQFQARGHNMTATLSFQAHYPHDPVSDPAALDETVPNGHLGEGSITVAYMSKLSEYLVLRSGSNEISVSGAKGDCSNCPHITVQQCHYRVHRLVVDLGM